MSRIANYTLILSGYQFLNSHDDFAITIEFYNSDFVFRRQFCWYGDNLYLQYQHPVTRLRLDSIVITDSRLICSFICQVRRFLERFERDLNFKYKDSFSCSFHSK